jgi:hypothetical protein
MSRKSFLLLALSLPCIALPAFGQDYRWPLEGPRALTSTFAEHRAGHLHAGIDLKTWGQEGRQVYAVGDGYVWRIRTSPWGYGKGLYLKLADGNIAVYGHLAEYIPAIQRRVEKEQRAQGRYSTDFYPQPGEIPVHAGQIIAFSGRTGCAHPHLHFELRDPENRPLNPLLSGFPIADHRPPRLISLSIRPLDRQSTVDDGHDRQLYTLKWNGRTERYQLSTTPHVEGRIGLALAVHDLADGAENRLNVYALHLFVDDRLIFSTTYRRFDFSRTDKVDLDNDYALYRQGRGIYHNLFVAPGNDLPFYQPMTSGSGVIDSQDWSPGLHRVRIRAEDLGGNAREAEFSLLIDRRPTIEDFRVVEASESLHVSVRATDPDDAIAAVRVEVSQDAGRTWDLMEVSRNPDHDELYCAARAASPESVSLVRAWAEDQFGVPSERRIGSAGRAPEVQGGPHFQWQLDFFRDFAEILVESDRQLAREPKIRITQSGGMPRLISVHQEETGHFRGLLPLEPGLDGEAVVSITGRDLSGAVGAAGFTFPVHAVTRDRGGRVGDLQLGIEVLFEPGSIYQTFMGRVEVAAASSPPGLPMMSPAYSVYPDDCTFDAPARVNVALSEGQATNERIGLYRRSGSGRWRYIGRLTDGPVGTVGARVRSFSTFALLEDRIDPLIWRLRPADGSQTRDRRPLISIRLRDTGSGIGTEENVNLRVDGQKVISRYDPQIETVFYSPNEDLAYGQHHFEISVRDRAGNESRAESVFTVVD